MLANPRLARTALGGLCVGLIGLIAFEFAFPVAEVAQPQTDAVRDVPVPAGALAPDTDKDDLIAEILERPLFSPGRSPPEPAAAPQPEQKQKGPAEFQGRLAGVVLRPGGSEALFARDGEKPISVTEGQEIEGWTVDTIEADHVVISSDLGERTFEPTPDENAKGPAAARKLTRAQKQVAAAAASITPAQPAARKGAVPQRAPAAVKPPVKFPMTAPMQARPPAAGLKPQGVKSSQIVDPVPAVGSRPWNL